VTASAVRLNVTASQFPFISDQEGATVIIPNQDTYYVKPNQFTGETADKNIGIPQFLFLENCMPTSYGMSSIGFDNATPPFPDGSGTVADQLIYLRSRTGRRYLLNFDRASGLVYIYSPEVQKWVFAFTVLNPDSRCYVALVKGRCFFYFRNNDNLFEFGGFDLATSTWQIEWYGGVGGIDDLSGMEGIVGANNYLIFFSTLLTFYTIPPDDYGVIPDFTPSLGETGAASESPSVLKGIMRCCLPTQDGFYIFTSTNIVVAFYSGNIKFPWTYRELEGSAAINSLDSIAIDQDCYPKYAYTTEGLIKLGKTNCTPVHVEAAEFIGNNIYEYFDWPSKEILRRELSQPMRISLAYISGRWLVISYGAQGEIFTHAIIWDEHLKRWGKIQRNHSRALQWYGIPATLPSTLGYTYQQLLDLNWTYQDLLDMGMTYAMLGGLVVEGEPDIALEYKSLGFITLDGVVQVVNFDLGRVSDESVAILGRIQFSRSTRSDIISVWAENLQQNPTTEKTKLAVLSTDDSKNVSKTEYGWPVTEGARGVKQFNFCKSEGLNQYLRFEGDFDLSSIIAVIVRTGNAYG